MSPLQTAYQLTPARLTQVLRSDGALKSGAVIGIEQDAAVINRGLVSDVTRLTVSYSDGATGALPRNMILKSSKPNLHPEMAAWTHKEVDFYRSAAAQSNDLAVPHCYVSAIEPRTQASIILLDDLSQTHFQRPLPLPPSNRHCELIVESLADLHASFWADPRLGHTLGLALTKVDADQRTERLLATIPAFFDYLGDALLPAQRSIYERILSSSYLAASYERLINLDGVTLVHGDAHSGNLMLPRDDRSDRVVLIDWQLWDIGVAATDLAFLMALHWPANRRAVLERPLLERYYARLVQMGVDGYSWQDMWDDYRGAVITMVLIPIGQFRRQNPAGPIWFGLQDATAAFEDLHCAELLP